MRRTRITFVGFEDYWMTVATSEFMKRYGGEFDCRWMHWPSRGLGRLRLLWATFTSDLVVRMGMPFEFDGRSNRSWLAFCRLVPWVHPVNYWIGYDVMAFRRKQEAGDLSENDRAAVDRLSHITVTEHLAAELRSLGLRARNAELMGPERGMAKMEMPPLPDVFRVLGYWGESSFEHYGGPAFYEAARTMPDVPFEVLGTDGHTSPPAPPNVTFLGRLEDPIPVYERNVVLVRMIEHDAVPSGMIEEMFLLGRYVVYTYEWPYTMTVPYRDAGALIEALTSLRERHAAGTLPLNAEAREFTVLDSNPDQQAASMRAAFLEIMAGRL